MNRLNTRVAWDDATATAIDEITPDDRGLYTKKSVDELRQQYPNLTVITWDEAGQRTDDHHRKPPERITRAQFLYWLEVLPPVDWIRIGDGESFKISERIAGNITRIVVRYEREYWTLQDHIRMPHEDIIVLVSEARLRVMREHAPALFTALRDAVAILPDAWRKFGKPEDIAKMASKHATRIAQLDEQLNASDNRDELLRNEAEQLLDTLRELRAALPDPEFAAQSGVSREKIESIGAAIRAAEGWKTKESEVKPVL